jgi:2,3-dihydroxybenzoate decarboxylase
VATRKIAIEEAVTTEEFEHLDEAFIPAIKDEMGEFLRSRIGVGSFEQRLNDMDDEGIDVQIISLTSPGVQSIGDPEHAAKSAKRANDSLAEMVSKAPTRFKAMAALPWINPDAAVVELQRAVNDLGAVGVMLNGHTKGAYMDDKAYWPVWEKVAELDVPVYLHPIQGQYWDNCAGYPELSGPPWGWAFETGTHFWRLVLSGLFDAYPSLTVILGHMGEFIPFSLWRFDNRSSYFKLDRGLAHPPSYYAKKNLMVTTAGVCSDESLLCTQIALGSNNILFAVDYPYQLQPQAVQWIESAPISDYDRELICHRNAERIFRLT